MRYEDLPPALRAQVDAKVGTRGTKKRTTRRELRGTSPGRCRCGAEFSSYREWEKTHQGVGHARFDLTISGA